MTTRFHNSQDLFQKFIKGADKLADNVASTLGPNGRTVLLHQKGEQPLITKDGVTVAKFFELDPDKPFENAAAQVLKQAAIQTCEDAGDGTSTSTVLAREMIKAAGPYLAAGIPAIELKHGMEKAVQQIIEGIAESSKPISSEEDIAQIASISANNDEMIGALIAKAISAAGKDGAITIEESRSSETFLEAVEGFHLPAGYCARVFADEKTGLAKYEDPFVLVTDSILDSVQLIMPILEPVSRSGKPLIIVAEDIIDEGLAVLIANHMRGSMKVVGIKAPAYGQERRDFLEDLAVSVGTKVYSELEFNNVGLINLGTVKKVEISRFNSIFAGAPSVDYGKIKNTIGILKKEMEEVQDPQECTYMQERITRLSSAVISIKVGAHTEIELQEKRHRIDDALSAVRSAQEEGCLPGGGTFLAKFAKQLSKPKYLSYAQSLGFEIVKQAAEAPLRQIVENAGHKPDLILEKVQRANLKGFDAKNGKMVDMIQAGIIDPAKVTRCALENAFSAASTLMLTNYAIIKD